MEKTPDFVSVFITYFQYFSRVPYIAVVTDNGGFSVFLMRCPT